MDTISGNKDYKICFNEKMKNGKVVIIGAGAAGLSILNAMLKVGFKNISVFEKEDDIGGVWYSTRYPNLAIHSKSYNYRALDFHPVISKTEQATRDEVLCYMKDYVQQKGFEKYIKFNRKVLKITFDSRKKEEKCEVRVENTLTREEEKIESDLVICALGFSNAGPYHLPHFQGEESFEGTIIHSSQFNDKILEDIVSNRSNITVLGAGKSAHDILCTLKEREVNKITWLYKKSLWSFCFDKLYSGSILWIYYAILRAVRRKIRKFNWLMYLAERPLVWNKIVLNPLEQNTDVFNSRGALLKVKHFEILKNIKSLKTDIVKLEKKTVVLSSGEKLQSDYLICATGFERAENMPLILVIDSSGKVEKFDPRVKNAFFRGMIDPDLPYIALFTAEVLFPQQFVGFSFASDWLARFYSGALINSYSYSEMNHEIMKEFQWCGEGKYLSKGMPYTYQASTFEILPLIFSDIGLKPKLADQFFKYMANQEKFENLCVEYNQELAKLGPPGS